MAYTSEDPYNAVQEEIESSLQAARTLCSSYVRIRGYASAEEEKEAREEVRHWVRLRGVLADFYTRCSPWRIAADIVRLA